MYVSNVPLDSNCLSEEVRQRHVIASGMHLIARFVYILSIDYKNVVSSKVS